MVMRQGPLNRVFVRSVSDTGKTILGKIDPENHSAHDVQYSISAQDIVAVYLERWVPIPYFSTEQARQNGGPFNWARARLIRSTENNDRSPYFCRLRWIQQFLLTKMMQRTIYSHHSGTPMSKESSVFRAILKQSKL